MTEISKQPVNSNEGAQPDGGRSQYQHQTVTLNNTIGMAVVSILAFSLLAALIRQQKRYHELVTKLTKQ